MFEKKVVVFFYPSKNIGGAQLLFARIAELLILDSYKVVLLDLGNNFIYNYLTERNLNFDFKLVSLIEKYASKKDDIIILSLSDIWYFKNFITPNSETKFVFWDLHPFALVEATALSKIHKEYNNNWLIKISKFLEANHIKKIRNFFIIANHNHGIYFMCLRNFKTNQKLFSLDFEPNYLPIPIKINSEKKNFIDNPHFVDCNINNRILNIGWISRLEVDKVKILELLLNDIIRFNKEHSDIQISIHVIGEGPQIQRLNRYKNVLGKNLIITGLLYGEALNTYLLTKIDIGFSMGTSALEFASRNIPTVLVPSTTWKKLFSVRDQKYLWIFDSYGFDVAVEDFHLFANIKTLNQVIKEFTDDTNKEFSSKSLNHVLNNHSLVNIFNQFKLILNKTTFSFGEIEKIGIYNYNFLQRKLNLFKKVSKKIIIMIKN